MDLGFKVQGLGASGQFAAAWPGAWCREHDAADHCSSSAPAAGLPDWEAAPLTPVACVQQGMAASGQQRRSLQHKAPRSPAKPPVTLWHCRAQGGMVTHLPHRAVAWDGCEGDGLSTAPPIPTICQAESRSGDLLFLIIGGVSTSSSARRVLPRLLQALQGLSLLLSTVR